MHKYIIMGPQGCGKGTQAKMMQEDLGLVHISVGEILRWNIENHTKIAAVVKRFYSKGELVPDDIIDNIVQRRLERHDWNYGFILDGFPRNRSQTEFFLESYDINVVIHIHITDETVLKRTLSRRVCSGCGLDYNLIYHRPISPDICDFCKGKLASRSDDNEDTIRERLHEYHKRTEPVLTLFKKKELVIQIDGEQGCEDVQQEIRAKLGENISVVP